MSFQRSLALVNLILRGNDRLPEIANSEVLERMTDIQNQYGELHALVSKTKDITRQIEEVEQTTNVYLYQTVSETDTTNK